MTNEYDEVDYVIKTLQTTKLEKEKQIILISSIQTWVNTPPKYEEPPEEGAEEEEEENKEEDELPESEPEEGEEDEEEEKQQEEEIDEENEVVKKKVVFYKEKDYNLRVPAPRFQYMKTLETLALSSIKTQPLLKVYILCAGVLYGLGERIFYEHFKMAWLQNPMKLPFIGEGDNLVPTIHVVDLARLVRRIVQDKPTGRPYIFAIDKTRNPT